MGKYTDWFNWLKPIEDGRRIIHELEQAQFERLIEQYQSLPEG